MIHEKITSSNWRDWAACKGKPTVLFFPKRGKTTAAGKKICDGCPVHEFCGTYAEQTRQENGVWDGKLYQPSGRETAPDLVICHWVHRAGGWVNYDPEAMHPTIDQREFNAVDEAECQ